MLPVQLYPNPAVGDVQISFVLDERAVLHLQITNSNGNTVFTQPTKRFEKGKVMVALTVNQLPRGNYQVSLVDETQSVLGSAQLMVIH